MSILSIYNNFTLYFVVAEIVTSNSTTITSKKTSELPTIYFLVALFVGILKYLVINNLESIFFPLLILLTIFCLYFDCLICFLITKFDR